MISEIEFNGVKWKNYQGVLIPDTPPHARVELSENDAGYLLKESGAYFLRWTTGFDCSRETDFWYVIKDGSGSMEDLNTKIRTKVRRGLKNCNVEKVSAEYIGQNGYHVYISAFERYRTFLKPVSKDVFQDSILALRDNPAYEFFAVFCRSDNKLIAYNQNYIQDNSLNYSVTKFCPEYLKQLPSYALFHTMNNHYLNERKVKYVNDGARSLSHDTNIQGYLIDNFRFRKAYCRLNMAYNKKIKIITEMLYPFRNIIDKIDSAVAAKIFVLLKHEEIRRRFERT